MVAQLELENNQHSQSFLFTYKDDEIFSKLISKFLFSSFDPIRQKIRLKMTIRLLALFFFLNKYGLCRCVFFLSMSSSRRSLIALYPSLFSFPGLFHITVSSSRRFLIVYFFLVAFPTLIFSTNTLKYASFNFFICVFLSNSIFICRLCFY